LTNGYSFQATIKKDDVFTAISEFADTPQHAVPKVGAHIQEMLPEFTERNLVSLYAELRSTNEKVSNTHFFRRLLMLDNVDLEGAAPENSSAAITPYSIKQAQYRAAMVALLDPDYLFGYQPFDHNTFVSLFEVTFFTADIRNSKLPSTDCLEKTADCGASPNTGPLTPVAGGNRSAGVEG
jgi:hypothetical protein